MELLDTLMFDRLPVVTAVVGLALVISFVWPRIARKAQYYRFPRLEKPYDLKAPEAVYEEGYSKFRNDIYRLTTPDGTFASVMPSHSNVRLQKGYATGEHMVVPGRYLDELRGRPDDEIDVLKAFMKVLENDYIQLFPGRRNTSIVNGVVKKELTRNLGMYK